MKLRIQKTRQVKTPTRSHQYDAGLDFYIPDDMPWATYTIWPGTQLLIPTGIKADIPEGFALFCFERSSMATKGLICGARVCDAEYQGEIHMHVMNPTKNEVSIKPGQKLAQFILMPVMNTEVIVITDRPLYDEVTDRGEGGFGSTGSGLPHRIDYKWEIGKAIEEQKGQKLSTPEDSLPKLQSDIFIDGGFDPDSYEERIKRGQFKKGNKAASKKPSKGKDEEIE